MSTISSPKDWLILQCQACGSPMKVRADAVNGSRVSCPSCRSPVAVQAPGSAGAPEFRAVLPQPGERVVSEATRRRALEEFQGDAEFSPTPVSDPEAGNNGAEAAYDPAFLRGLKNTDEFHSGSHIKVKKRRRKGVEGHRDILTDWDVVLETLPVAEIYSDPWTESVPIPEEVIKEKSRDFVVSEDRDDGGIVRRVKRVRKRRLFTWAQLFFRRLSFGMRIFTVTMVSAITLGGIAWGVIIFRKHFKPVTYDDVVSEARPGQIHLTSQDESGASDAVRHFLAAVGPEAKLTHVRLPNRVKPMMEKWYARYTDSAAEIGEVKARNKIRTDGLYFVIVELDVIEPDPSKPAGKHTRTRSFAVEETEIAGVGRTYKVDWETAVEWRPMSFEEFKRIKPNSNVPFRVKIRGSGYYNHLFADEKEWLAAEVYYPYPEGQNLFLFHGYMERPSEVFRRLSPYTETGSNASVILNLRYPETAISPEQVIIDSIVHDSWFYTTDTPPKDLESAMR